MMRYPKQNELKEFFELNSNGLLIYKKHFHLNKIGKIAEYYASYRERSFINFKGKTYRADRLTFLFKYGEYAKYVYNINGDRRDNSINNLINLKTLEKKFDGSQKMLHERIVYDPESGEVKWKAQKDMCNIGNPILGMDAHGYKIINIDYTTYKLHRIIWLYMTGNDSDVIDHIDHNRTNNTFANLANGTKQDNEKNKTILVNNTSGHTGIITIHRKSGEKYKAFIGVDSKSIHLGCFDLIDDAIACRKDAEVKYGFHTNHGDERIIETLWRTSREYRIWRATCIRRDKTCQICNTLQSRQVHHKNNAEDHPDQRFDTENGITLCRNCHTQYHCNYHKSFREKTTKYDYDNFVTLTNYYKSIFIDKDENKNENIW